MPKYYKRKYYRGNRDKYSVEQTAGTLATDALGDGGTTVVVPTTVQGMRKVKHLTISMAQNTSGTGLFWALVYVPQGTTVNKLNVDEGNMYEPNQFVMSCGIFDVDAGPMRITSPVSRNLNSGDSIALVLHSNTPSTSFSYVVRYAVTLQ